MSVGASMCALHVSHFAAKASSWDNAEIEISVNIWLYNLCIYNLTSPERELVDRPKVGQGNTDPFQFSTLRRITRVYQQEVFSRDVDNTWTVGYFPAQLCSKVMLGFSEACKGAWLLATFMICSYTERVVYRSGNSTADLTITAISDDDNRQSARRGKLRASQPQVVSLWNFAIFSTLPL